jgi:hypothetical protein
MNAQQRRASERAEVKSWGPPFWAWTCECVGGRAGELCSDKRRVVRVQRAHDEGRHHVRVESPGAEVGWAREAARREAWEAEQAEWRRRNTPIRVKLWRLLRRWFGRWRDEWDEGGW